MSTKGGQYYGDFAEKFEKIVKDVIPPEAEKGLVKAGNELLRDAIKTGPGAPKDTGALWASASTRGSDNVMRSVRNTVLSRPIISENARQIEIDCGFNIEYAAQLHEMPLERAKTINWSERGATDPGPKFLESKMARFRDKYIKIVALHIRRLAR